MKRKSGLWLNKPKHKKSQKRIKVGCAFDDVIVVSPFTKKRKLNTPSPIRKILSNYIIRTPTKTNTPIVNRLQKHSPALTNKTVKVKLFGSSTRSMTVADLKTKFDQSAYELQYDFFGDISILPDNDNDVSNNEEVEEMARLSPIVIRELQKSGIENVFLDFFRLVSKGAFPINNISFLLWVELVRWYKSGNTCAMRYEDETKKFWKLGWRLFGGKFIRFMSGFKNTSQVVCGDVSRGNFRPEDSDINFVVPDVSVLRRFSPYGLSDANVRTPGIYPDIIKAASSALSRLFYCSKAGVITYK